MTMTAEQLAQLREVAERAACGRWELSFPCDSDGATIDREHVRREHAVWSQATFGNVGPVGPLKHLSKEALEAAAAPEDLSEWADMQFLLWDAQRRAGITDEQITQAMVEKLAVNKQREWPEPKDGEPRLHIAAPAVQAEQLSVDTLTNVLRNAPVAPSDSQGNKRVNSPVIPDGWLAEAERLAELHGASFVLFRHGQEPVCADPSKFWFGYDPAAPEKDFREMPNSSTNNCRENAETSTKCWIPVSERMPDETQPVIVVADGGVVQRTVYQFCDGVWIDWYEQYDEVPHDAFTHWMPLPAAPKQEAE